MSTKEAGRLTRFGQYLARTYATADPRSLGLFRIALGLLLFKDVLRRLPDLDAHYTNIGWLTNHYALFRPMSDHFFSIYAAFSTPGEVRVLFSLHLLVNLLLIVGWHTRLMHVLAAILITSLNSRTIMLENGGWVVLNILTVWSMFLPCGQRFSVDALRASLRKQRDLSPEALNDPSFLPRTTTPVVSLAFAALVLQWAVIYYFNCIHKNGESWRDGTAIYYFLQQDRMVTWVGAWVRQVLPLAVTRVLTWSTLVIEGSIAALLVVPFSTHVTRMIAWALVCSLHLSIDALVQLGPFSWAMMTVFVAFIPRQFWEYLERRGGQRKPERHVLYAAKDGLSITLCRLIRRFDVYGRVRFVPLETAGETVQAAERAWLVTSADGATVWQNSEALARLGDALPLGGLLRVARLPGLSALVDRLLALVVTRRARLSSELRLAHLPSLPDERAKEPSPASAWLRRLGDRATLVCVAVVMIAETSQVLIENNVLPGLIIPERRAEWMNSIVVYPRLFQGWSMFSPAPPTEDGHVVIDGRTQDGRKLDPLTGREPDFDVQPVAGYKMNQIWGDFHRRIGEPRFDAYWDGFREFLIHHHELTGRPADRLVAFDVWYVIETIPPPGVPPNPPQQRKLFAYGSVQ